MNILTQIRGYSWGEIVYNPRSSFGPRWQERCQLVLIHSGYASIRVDGEAYSVHPDEVILLYPGHEEHYRFSVEEPTHHSWIHAEFAAGGLAQPGLSKLLPVIVPIGKRLKWIMGELLEKGITLEPARENLAASLAEAAFYDVLERSGLTVNETSPGHPSVGLAIDVINSRYTDNLDLKQIASASGLSPQHLSRLFRGQTGLTPVRYLWRIREDAGRRMLRETGLTIAEIAEACGFQNPFHFTRRMAERFGQSPRSLRRKDWEGQAGT
jgi:AraC family transcriptional regulator of arabinose operon